MEQTEKLGKKTSWKKIITSDVCSVAMKRINGYIQEDIGIFILEQN